MIRLDQKIHTVMELQEEEKKRNERADSICVRTFSHIKEHTKAFQQIPRTFFMLM